MKYIDVENLKSLIKERYNTYKIGQHSPFRNGKVETLREIIELIDSLQREQTVSPKSKFVFPKFLYARTKDNKTIDVSYAPQSLDAIEYIRSDSLQQEQPKPYFYCKYGGTIPLCSDCKRNHNNSSFKTEEITTWYAPSNGTKHCIDFIQQEQPEVDLEKEISRVSKNEYFDFTDWKSIARHFFEVGMKQAKVDDALVEEIYSHIDGIKDTADRMTSGNFMHHRAAIKFSANVIKNVLSLMGLKAQKGK